MLYVCENNLYSAGTIAAETLALSDVAARAAGYGIPGVVVDGNDVMEVYEAAEAAVNRARARVKVPASSNARPIVGADIPKDRGKRTHVRRKKSKNGGSETQSIALLQA